MVGKKKTEVEDLTKKKNKLMNKKNFFDIIYLI